jgi:hypothetical protein
MAACFLGTARRELIRVLERLIERDSGAFVVVDVKGASRFVQFAGSRDDPLIIDVPSEQLSAEETERARLLFEALGNAVPSEWGFQADCSRPPASQRNWESVYSEKSFWSTTMLNS